MNKVCYLVQGHTDLLEDFPYPRDRDIWIAAYNAPFDMPGAKARLHIPGTTWAEGRNILLAEAKASHDYDYYIFCDDDLRFERGSFAEFERLLDTTRPIMGAPVTPKSREFGYLEPDAPIQRAMIFDEQLVALHKSVIGRVGIAPLVSEYDPVSWLISCDIFEHLLVAEHFPYLHQYNTIEVANDAHRHNDGTSGYVLKTKGIKKANCVAEYFAREGFEYNPDQLSSMARPIKRKWLKRLAFGVLKRRHLSHLAKDWRSLPPSPT